MRFVHAVCLLVALLALSACSGEEVNTKARTESLPAFSLGKSLDEIVRESTANMAQFDAAMRLVSQSETRVEYEGTIKGNDARLIATIDMPKQQVGVLLLVGENDQVRKIVASIRMANPVLNFAGAR